MVTTVLLPSFLRPLTGWLVWRVEPDPVATGGDAEAGWMGRVATGDETALQHLFDRWKRPLLSFFYRSLGSHADAEDLTLEVFVRLHRSAPDYQPTAKFSTYLFHIAQNLLRNELRHRRRKPADTVPPELLDELPQDHTAGRRLAELEEILQQALTRLPEKHRTALLLIHQQQLEYPAAAAALRMTENALRVLVHRARQQLKIEMEARP
jgi:RNA polymerase sigma-70 factor (ECF subfamily)